jgi:hypothetical protein
VRVAAELHVQTRRGDVGKVGGHDLRAAAVERERRDHHAAVADGYEIRLAGLVLRLQQADRIGTVGRRLPAFEARPRHPLAGKLPRFAAFLERRMRDLPSRHWWSPFRARRPTHSWFIVAPPGSLRVIPSG